VCLYDGTRHIVPFNDRARTPLAAMTIQRLQFRVANRIVDETDLKCLGNIWLDLQPSPPFGI
jgi:hypothetical protein